jgi:ParB/RepB/Spo0J family partition protein
MNATAPTPTPATPGILPIASLERSPTNPRKFFDAEKLKQLGETIKSQGFLQKLLVRPWPGRANVFEIVDGERRWRAAKSIGVEMVPVDVRQLTDAQVIEIQLVAGDTGEPLTPLEEGEGFKTALGLKDAKGEAVFSLRSLAEKLGCSKSHIEQRIDLLRLPPNVRDWVSSGSLAPRTANLLARIPDAESRDKAIQDIVFPKHREDPLPYKEAEAVIHERYMVALRGTPFDLNDETLGGPEAGKPIACNRCPLKTGNNLERFGDVKDKNTCTNPGCYRAKCNAAWDRTAAKAKAAGQRVLTDEESTEVFEKNSPTVQIAFSSPYVDVDSKPTYRHVPNEVEDKNLPTWRELIETASEKKGIKVPIVLARDRAGKQWQLVQLTLAIEAARAIGEDMFKKTPVTESLNAKDRFDRDAVRSTVRATDDFAQKKKAEADAAKRRALEGTTALVSLHSALAERMIGAIDVTDALLSTAMHHAGNDGLALVAKAFGLRGDSGDFGVSDAIEAWFKKLPYAERHAAIPVLLIAQSVRWNGLKCEGFAELAKAVALDVAAIEKQVAAKLGDKAAKDAKQKPAAASAPTSAAAPAVGTLVEWPCPGGSTRGLVISVADYEKNGVKWVKDWNGSAVPIKVIKSADRMAAPYAVVELGSLTTLPASAAGELTEGQYIAAKTLMTAGKELRKVQEQLKLTNAQTTAVLERFNMARAAAVPKKKRAAGKAAVKAVRASVKTKPGKAGKKGAKK